MNARLTLGLSVVSALVAGAAGGYLVARHLLQRKYAAELEQEISRTQTFYAMKHKKDEFETVEKAVEALGTPNVEVVVEQAEVAEAVRAFTQYGGHRLPAEGVVQNVFASRVVHDDPSEEEIQARTEEAPYPISHTEFQVNEDEYEQVTIEWYTADEILVDDKDEPVPDPDELVGIDNLRRFGHLSGDPRVIYVRNDARSMDFMIVMNDNSYAQVLGMKD